MRKQTMSASRVAIAIGLVASAAVSCSRESPSFVSVCTRELTSTLTPHDTAVALGSHFTARVALASCGGSEHLTDTFTWISEDSSIARVDPASGNVTATGLGGTTLSVTGVQFGQIGRTHVTVRSAP
jgi:uncharacterized protein YjdB